MHMGGIQTRKSSKGEVAELPEYSSLLPDLTKHLHDGIKPSVFAPKTNMLRHPSLSLSLIEICNTINIFIKINN